MSDTKEKMKRAELAAALGRLGELNPYNTAAKSAGDAATGLAMQYQQKLDEEEAKKKKSSGLASIVGGAVGFAVGGPAGAAVGAGLGETAESKIRGNELGDSLMAGGKAGLSALLLGNAAEGAGLTKEFVQAKLGRDTFAQGALTKTDALNGMTEDMLLEPLEKKPIQSFAKPGIVQPEEPEDPKARLQRYADMSKELSTVLVGDGGVPETMKTPDGQTSIVGLGGPTIMKAPVGSAIVPMTPEAEVGRQIAEKLKPGSGELGAALGQWVGTKAAEQREEKSSPRPVFGMTPEQVLAQREATSRDDARKAAETLRREEMAQERTLSQEAMNQQAKLAHERTASDERIADKSRAGALVDLVLKGEISAEQFQQEMQFEKEKADLEYKRAIDVARIGAAGGGNQRDYAAEAKAQAQLTEFQIISELLKADPESAVALSLADNARKQGSPYFPENFGMDYDAAGNPTKKPGASGSVAQPAPAASDEGINARIRAEASAAKEKEKQKNTEARRLRTDIGALKAEGNTLNGVALGPYLTDAELEKLQITPEQTKAYKEDMEANADRLAQRIAPKIDLGEVRLQELPEPIRKAYLKQFKPEQYRQYYNK